MSMHLQAILDGDPVHSTLYTQQNIFLKGQLLMLNLNVNIQYFGVHNLFQPH